MSQKVGLLVGNSEYKDTTLAQLVTPAGDVSALAEVLRDPQRGGFDEVRTLVNQSAQAIRLEAARLFAGRSRNDLVLLYFSGHGVRDDRGELYLAAKDTDHTLLSASAVPAAFITAEMDHSHSKRQVLILDCCHSGAFARGAKGAAGASVGTAAAFEGTGYGHVVLTATDTTQYAWEGEEVAGQAEKSVFTRYLIEGLLTGEADADGDGQISIDELYDYVYERVVKETPRQTPGKWAYKQQGEFMIARNPHPVVKPAELPRELQQTIEDPRPWVREGGVRELDRLLHGGHKGLELAAHAALKQLKDDDSRRVSSLAAGILAVYSQVEVRPEAEQWERERLQEEEREEAARKEEERRVREGAAQLQQGRRAQEQTGVPAAGIPPGSQQKSAAVEPIVEGRAVPKPNLRWWVAAEGVLAVFILSLALSGNRDLAKLATVIALFGIPVLAIVLAVAKPVRPWVAAGLVFVSTVGFLVLTIASQQRLDESDLFVAVLLAVMYAGIAAGVCWLRRRRKRA